MDGCEFGGNCVKRGNLIIESKEIQVDNFKGDGGFPLII